MSKIKIKNFDPIGDGLDINDDKRGQATLTLKTRSSS